MNSINENGSDIHLKSEAFKLCGDFLGGPWKCLALENFKFSTVSGGLSNSLYHCALPEDIMVTNSNVPREILLRIYGPLQDDVGMILAESAIFILLSERNLGPKLYGIFPKGRLEEYIPSRSIKCAEIRALSTTIATEMARIHALDVPIRKIPDMWTVHMNKWMKDIAENPSKNKTEISSLLEMYRAEIDWTTKEMAKKVSTPAFCHNDLQGGNILLREDSAESGEPELMLIDFEFASYNYRTFDIANHFCEWCFDYNTEQFPFFEVDFNKFPDENEQMEYIKCYLDELVKQGALPKKSLESEMRVILSEIDFFAMAAHLIWSLWSIKMMQTSSMDFAHREHGNTRRKRYFHLKEQYLKSSAFNGEQVKKNND